MKKSSTTDWPQILGQFKASGQRAQEFADLHGISVHTLRHRLRREKQDKPGRRSSEFIQIPLKNPTTDKVLPEISIHVEEGSTEIRIRFVT